MTAVVESTLAHLLSKAQFQGTCTLLMYKFVSQDIFFPLCKHLTTPQIYPFLLCWPDPLG